MQVPEYVKPGIWGAVVGAIAVSIIGFSLMGWTTAGTAERVAKERADTAVVAALVPFCVANARQDADSTKLVKFKAEASYQRGQFVSGARLGNRAWNDFS